MQYLLWEKSLSSTREGCVLGEENRTNHYHSLVSVTEPLPSPSHFPESSGVSQVFVSMPPQLVM